MSIATFRDLEVTLMRPLTEAESPYVQALLDRAENQIIERIPDTLARAQTDQLWRGAVAEVEAEAVARVVRAPSGGVYRSEAEGDYQYSLNTTLALGKVNIRADEWRRLLGEWRSYQPQTDGYLATRHGGMAPDLAFQGAWPAYGAMAPRWGAGPWARWGGHL